MKMEAAKFSGELIMRVQLPGGETRNYPMAAIEAPLIFVERIHRSPGRGSVTPCCGRTPFELSTSDRMTNDQAFVTCHELDDPDLGIIDEPEVDVEKEVMRAALRSIRAIAATSGTDVNAWNRALDLLDPLATKGLI